MKVEEAAPAALPPVDEPLPVEEEKKPAPAPKIFTKADLASIPRKPSPTIPSPAACAARRPAPTSRHLANHGINVEEYKYLCGYPSEQKLMSRKFEAKMRRNVQRAQQARKEKRRAENA